MRENHISKKETEVKRIGICGARLKEEYYDTSDGERKERWWKTESEAEIFFTAYSQT